MPSKLRNISKNVLSLKVKTLNDNIISENINGCINIKTIINYKNNFTKIDDKWKIKDILIFDSEIIKKNLQCWIN